MYTHVIFSYFCYSGSEMHQLNWTNFFFRTPPETSESVSSGNFEIFFFQISLPLRIIVFKAFLNDYKSAAMVLQVLHLKIFQEFINFFSLNMSFWYFLQAWVYFPHNEKHFWEDSCQHKSIVTDNMLNILDISQILLFHGVLSGKTQIHNVFLWKNKT